MIKRIEYVERRVGNFQKCCALKPSTWDIRETVAQRGGARGGSQAKLQDP